MGNYYKRIKNICLSNAWRFSSAYCYKNIVKWRRVKGKYKGKRCFLIANGPSLNMTPLYLLKDEYTIMFNRASLMVERLNFCPNFYMVTDSLVANNIKDEIQFYLKTCEKVFVPDITKGELLKIKDFVPFDSNVYFMYDEPMVRFSHTLPFMSVGGTVIFAAFQVLKYLGFDEVVVVGNDMNYVLHKNVDIIKEQKSKYILSQELHSQKDDDPNHFDPRYFGKGREFHQPNEGVINRIFSSLDVVAREYEKAGVKVINAGYNSMVNSFPKQDFYDALCYPQEKIDKIFDDLLKSKGLKSKEWLFEKAILIEDDFRINSDVVSVPMNKATEVVKDRILDYIPLGPYNGNVFFVKRTLIQSCDNYVQRVS